MQGWAHGQGSQGLKVRQTGSRLGSTLDRIARMALGQDVARCKQATKNQQAAPAGVENHRTAATIPPVESKEAAGQLLQAPGARV